MNCPESCIGFVINFCKWFPRRETVSFWYLYFDEAFLSPGGGRLVIRMDTAWLWARTIWGGIFCIDKLSIVNVCHSAPNGYYKLCSYCTKTSYYLAGRPIVHLWVRRFTPDSRFRIFLGRFYLQSYFSFQNIKQLKICSQHVNCSISRSLILLIRHNYTERLMR